ncbi:helix-turn-helix domain-containing protein [Streptomyces fimicarius]|uniref:helix-turn-helix domain-containing protein n=1 Tax=Streptomyces griseus TaxID=1911 RepID=UPI0036A21F21
MTPEHARLVAALRELRAGAGLSLAALAERTTYSKSSWERYLNGKALPPRQAVQELCRLADQPQGRPLALWEIAESRWSGRSVATPQPASSSATDSSTDFSTDSSTSSTSSTEGPPPQPVEAATTEGPRRRLGRSRLLALLASAYSVIVGGVAVVLLFLLPDSEAHRAEPTPSSVPFSFAPLCHGAACEGRDPMRLICGIGPDTLAAHRTATGAHVELRHSEKCGASWVRTWGTEIGDRVDVTADGPTHSVRIENAEDAATFVYTGMTEATVGGTVRACFRPASADGERECFEARVTEPSARTPSPSAQSGSGGGQSPTEERQGAAAR